MCITISYSGNILLPNTHRNTILKPRFIFSHFAFWVLRLHVKTLYTVFDYLWERRQVSPSSSFFMCKMEKIILSYLTECVWCIKEITHIKTYYVPYNKCYYHSIAQCCYFSYCSIKLFSLLKILLRGILRICVHLIQKSHGCQQDIHI